jgi:hypothetical protein
VAIAVSAAAVLIAVLAATRLEVEWRPGQLTVSWSAEPRPTEVPVPAASAPAPPPVSEFEERIEALEEVARLVSDELRRNDARHAAVLAELGRLPRWQRYIEARARQSDHRSQRAEEGFQALYAAQYSPHSNDKGAIP